MKEQQSKKVKEPTALFAGIAFAVIIVALIILINLGVSTIMALFIGAILSGAITFILHQPWGETEKKMLEVVSKSIMTFLIVLMVGMLVGIWMAGGTVPSLMYYGMKLISPRIMVPLAFILCCITSEFTGTCFGSIATMALAMVAVASTTTIPMPLVVAACVCGSTFGDKMSPLSDTTNLASGMARVPLYTHVNSMMYTTIPAALVSLVIFAILGFRYSGEGIDSSQAALFMDTLKANFVINPIIILPVICILLVSVLKIPVLIGFGGTIIISSIFAMISQHIGFLELAGYAVNGFSIETGVAAVDPILNRGGVMSMTELLVIYIIASVMGGLLTATGIMDVLARDVLVKVIKSRPVLIISSLIYCYVINFLTAGGQTPAIIITNQTFGDAYDALNIDRRVLSRTTEDSATISAAVVPWGAGPAFIMATLGCTIDYIPYCFFIFIVPVFSIICAITKWGVWDAEGNPLWKKKAA